MEYFFSLRGALISLILLFGIFGSFTRPKIGLYIITLMVLLGAGFLKEWFPPIYDYSMPQISIYFVLGCCLLNLGKNPIRMNWDFVLLFLFLSIICLSRFLSGNLAFEGQIFTEYSRNFLFIFLICQLIRTPKDIRNYLWLLLGIYFFLVLRAYYNYKTMYMDIAVPNYSFVDRNDFASQLNMMMPIAYILARSTKNKVLRLVGYAATFWFIVGVILTYSRGGALALGVGFLGLLFFERKRAKLIIGILIAMIIILPRLSEKYLGRVHSIETYEEDASSMGRIGTYMAALNMFKSSPFIGVGAGNSNDLLVDFTPSEYFMYVDRGKSIHSITLQCLAETGLAGTVVFFMLMWRAFWHTYIRKKSNIAGDHNLSDLAIALRVSFLALFIGQQLLPGVYYGPIYILLPILISFGMLKKKEKQISFN